MSGIQTVSVAPSHVTIDDKGIARIDGTRMKVIFIAQALKAGETAEQMRDAWPHLSLAQIHSAISYYYDHQPQIDAEIERTLEEARTMRAAAPETPGRKKLRDMGLRP